MSTDIADKASLVLVEMAPADQHKDEAGGAVVHDPPPTVRFSSAVEEISPATTAGPPAPPETGISDVTAADIKALASTLQVTPLQGRRVTTFLFDPLPMSLPASRVCRPHFGDSFLESSLRYLPAAPHDALCLESTVLSGNVRESQI